MPVPERSQPGSVPGSPYAIGPVQIRPSEGVGAAPARSAADLSRGGLNAADLCRSFGDERAVDHVDLQVVPGQIHALVGLNGAGKTTLMRLVLGMLRPDRGSVTIFGRQAPTPGTTCGAELVTCSTRRSATPS